MSMTDSMVLGLLQQAAVLDALHQRGHQELVALDSLRVVTQAEALARAPERQRFPAVDMVACPP